jgi:hypothetical protein
MTAREKYSHPRVDEIRARLAAITPGEWEAGRPDMGTVVDGVTSKWIYARKDSRSQYVAVASGRIDGPWEEVIANSQFIGHAPADIAWLLDALDDEFLVAEDRRERSATPTQRPSPSADRLAQISARFALENAKKLQSPLKVVDMDDVRWLIEQSQFRAAASPPGAETRPRSGDEEFWDKLMAARAGTSPETPALREALSQLADLHGALMHDDRIVPLDDRFYRLDEAIRRAAGAPAASRPSVVAGVRDVTDEDVRLATDLCPHSFGSNEHTGRIMRRVLEDYAARVASSGSAPAKCVVCGRKTETTDICATCATGNH